MGGASIEKGGSNVGEDERREMNIWGRWGGGGDGRVFKKNRRMIKNSCFLQPMKINQEEFSRTFHTSSAFQIQHSIHRYLAETSFQSTDWFFMKMLNIDKWYCFDTFCSAMLNHQYTEGLKQWNPAAKVNRFNHQFNTHFCTLAYT